MITLLVQVPRRNLPSRDEARNPRSYSGNFSELFYAHSFHGVKSISLDPQGSCPLDLLSQFTCAG